MFKKALSILLAVMLVVSAFSMATVVYAAESTDTVADANTEVDAVGGDDTLTVKATSNLFPEQTMTFTQEELAANDNKVTVTYFINSEKDLLNTQWALSYDGDKLGVDPTDNQAENEDEEIYSTVMPKAPDAVINFTPDDMENGIRGNCTKLGLYKMSKKGAQVGFVSVTFRAKGTGEATVNLDVEEMRMSKLQSGQTQTQEADEEQLVEGSVVKDVTFNYTPVSTIYGGNYDEKATNPAEEPTTTEEATTVEETTEEPTTVEETTEEPTTVEETTVEPDTEAPTTAEPAGGDKLNVKVTSNLFGEHTKSYDASTKQITVVYEVNCPGYAIVNGDFEFTYDPAIFSYADSNTDDGIMPVVGSKLVATTPKTPLFGEEGVVTGNFSDVNNTIKMYNSEGTPVTLFTVVFDVKDGAKGDTVCDLKFKNFKVCKEDVLPEQGAEQIIKKSTLQVPAEELEKLGLNDYSTAGEEEPTTVEPTTEPGTEPAEDKVYSICGQPEDVFGGWDASNVATEMTKGDDGKFYFTTPMDTVQNAQFKVVVNHSWDENYGDNGNNVVFNVTSPCDVTICFDPETKEITVTGDGVDRPIGLEIKSMRAVGNGEGNWLNGVSWDPADDANLMTEVADGVYEITFNDVNASFGYSIKFAANGDESDWTYNWGGVEGNETVSGTTYDAVYDGKDINVEVEDDGATVTAQIDVRDFDFKSKTGAKYTITITYPGDEPTTVAPTTEEPTTEEPTTEEPTTEEPTTVEPTTEEPTTEEPTTVEPTTEEPTTEEPTTEEPTTEEPTTEAPKLHVTTTSNFFPADDLGDKNVGETFDVAYDYQQPDANLIVSGQFRFEYDADKVTLEDIKMPNIGEYSYFNTVVDEQTGKTITYGNFANENGFDFSTEKNFVTATFKAVNGGEEEIKFVVMDLLNKEWAIVKDEVIQEKPEEPTTAEPVTTEEPTTEAPIDADFIAAAQSVTAEPVVGTTVEVPVDFTKNPGYGYGYVTVGWDKDSLVLKEIKYTDLAPKQASAAPISNDGTYKVSFGDMMAMDNFTGTGNAFTLVFEVNTTTEGDYAITLSAPEVYDCEINTIDAATIDGKVTLGTEEPTTEEPTTEEPTTEEPTTEEPTTAVPTTEEPTTEEPTTEEPTTVEPTTEEPTTEEPTTVEPTTEEPTTEEPTTVEPTTEEPTTVEPTTVEPTTVEPTTEETTVEDTTAAEETTEEITSSTDATSETQKPATKDSSSDSTSDSGNGSNGGTNGAVQTGNASMAIIILLVLISATGAIYFARKKVK